MTLTKKLESEILDLYHKYWDAYLNGNMKIMSSLMDENCQVIGSGQGEVFRNRETAVKYYSSTADQVTGKVEMRNRQISIAPAGSQVLITEENDFFILMDSVWTFYGQGRISTLFAKSEGQWKITHQHGSLPDARTGGGEQVNTDKIREENVRLKDAIKRRTIELEEKNRELEIEASLERVRARSMAMQKSEELKDVIQLVYQQLVHLKINVEHAGFVVDYTPKGDWNFWIADQREIPSKITHPYFDSVWAHQFDEAKEKGIDFFTTNLNFEEKNKFYSDLFKFIPDVPQESLDYYFNCTGLAASTVLQDNVGLYIENFSRIPYSDDENATLMRFGKVFQQAYTRFLDLRKAEAQAREAQIEAALERVRARTMAMHRGDELADTALVLFDQLMTLDFRLRGCGFLIMDEESRTMEDWSANLDEHGKGSIITGTLAFDQHPILTGVVDTWRKGEPYFIGGIEDEKELQEYFEAVTSRESTTEKMKEKVLAVATSEWTNSFYFEYGMMYVMTPERITEHEIHIMTRFADVFRGTYRRFLDLKQAEAQAREAQIEAALERVRSRTMAMHRSEELSDTATLLFQELRQLQIEDLWMSGFALCEKGNSTDEFWLSTESGEMSTLLIPNDVDPAHRKMYQAWETGSDYISFQITGKELAAHYAYLKTIPEVKSDFEEMEANGYPLPGFQELHAIYFSHGYLLIITLTPYNGGETLKRFGKVFDQAYRRFLDLKKAEAQAREAQIETAVERIRGKALAMRTSEEILEVAVGLREEMVKLGLEGVSAATIYLEQENGNLRIWDLTELIESADGPHLSLDFEFSLAETDPDLWIHRIWNCQESFYIAENDEEDIVRGEAFLRKFHTDESADNFTDFVKTVSLKHVWLPTVPIANGKGRLNIGFTQPPPSEIEVILPKMGQAFDLAYTRFQDLQQAEAQAREAQIEAALERVRARTMAMHHSEEFAETATVLFQQLNALGMNPERMNICIMKEDAGIVEVWTTEQGGHQINHSYSLRLDERTTVAKIYSGWKANKTSMTIDLSGSELDEWLDYIGSEVGMPLNQELVEAHRVHSVAFFSHGLLLMTTPQPVPAETMFVLERFSAVFNLTFGRFRDLQKAEAQAREAQIEAALERVRGKALAMHRSEDFLDTAHEIFLMQQELGLAPVRSGLSVVTDPDTMAWEAWSITAGEEEQVIPMSARFTSAVHSVSAEIFRHWQAQDPYWQTELSGESLAAFVKGMPRDYVPVLDAWTKLVRERARVYFHYFSFPEGVVFAGSLEPFTADQVAIMQRFTRVFDFAYTRYTDLKQAEEQAWEAQIEAALEKVRSSALAMLEPADMVNVCKIISQQLQMLGIGDIRNIQTAIFDADKRTLRNYQYFSAYDKTIIEDIAYDRHHTQQEMVHTMRSSKEAFFNVNLAGEKLQVFREYRKSDNQFPDPRLDEVSSLHGSFYAIGQGAIGITTYNTALSEEERELFKRFRNVFDLAYRRFMDIEQATAQTREAQIEAALERVRAQTMAMNRSQDLKLSVAVIFREMDKLDLKTIRCGIGLIDGEKRTAYVWSTTSTTEGFDVNVGGSESMDIHPVLQGAFDAWQRQQDFFYEFDREDLLRYYQALEGGEFELPEKNIGSDEKQYYFATFFASGGLYAFSQDPFSDEIVLVMQRFAKAFNLAYKRFQDLTQAENREKEALIQSSLDRARAEIASMRNANDLQRITPLVWREMKSLGLPFFRCGVFIMDEESSVVHAYLSTPDGRALGTLHLPFEADPVSRSAVEHWRKGTIYKEHWNREQFAQWMQSMIDRGQIRDTEKYQGAAEPPASLYLHFLPFTQGMLYVGNSDPLTEEETLLVGSLADAFAMAYARYEDFVQLEKAKQNVESALTELKAAQTQLIHSEKMASLGELTAGIAHEIKNPLNFVNNFSEVSQELLDEIQEELDQENYRDVAELILDVKDNLAKILDHGTRADSIVRSMLQHSRGSSAETELTDLNLLADEYLRLAYHGLRAKDKSFNAEFATDLDPTLPKINVVPQDIGRVLLNLVNNAFYACTERKSLIDVRSTDNVQRTADTNPYQPLVTVTTKRQDNTAIIIVADNGNGIPKDILDKIFQPFFTTKPTGEGTGLGLSLAYDIVTKGHGGQLAVETEKGIGTQFIIQIPVEQNP